MCVERGMCARVCVSVCICENAMLHLEVFYIHCSIRSSAKSNQLCVGVCLCVSVRVRV